MAENTTTEWCVGLPLIGQRPFEPEEQEYLQRLAQRLRWYGIMAVLSYPLLVCCFGVIEWIATSSIAQAKEAMMISGLLLLVVCLPMQLLAIRDAFGRRKALLGDLRCGFVKQFAGMMAPDVGTEATLIKLRQARIVPRTGTGHWSLELLPASRRMWRVQEQRVKPWIIANVVEVAQTPEMAGIAAQWLQPVTRNDDETLLGGRRALSQAERDELLRYARHAWTRPLPGAIGFTLWAGVRISSLLLHPLLNTGINWIFFTLFVFFTLLMDVALVMQVLLSRKLRQDAQAGHVIIVGVEKNAPSVSRVTPADTVPMIREVLPHSKREWTQEGRPAVWRTIRS